MIITYQCGADVLLVLGSRGEGLPHLGTTVTVLPRGSETPLRYRVISVDVQHEVWPADASTGKRWQPTSRQEYVTVHLEAV